MVGNEPLPIPRVLPKTLVACLWLALTLFLDPGLVGSDLPRSRPIIFVLLGWTGLRAPFLMPFDAVTRFAGIDGLSFEDRVAMSNSWLGLCLIILVNHFLPLTSDLTLSPLATWQVLRFSPRPSVSIAFSETLFTSS